MIQTNRLNLRTWQISDLHYLDAILGSPAVMEFSDQGTLDKAEQAAWLKEAQVLKHDAELPGILAIEQHDDGEVIGYISLSNDLRRVGRNDAELGFRLAKFAWGQGYAAEAAEGIIETLRRIATLERLVAIVDPHNHRSVHVLRKIGMTYENDVVFEGYDYPDHLYARDLRL